MWMSYQSRSMVGCRWQQSQGPALSSAAHPAHQLSLSALLTLPETLQER